MSALSFFYVCFPRISALFVMPEFSATRFKKTKKARSFLLRARKFSGKSFRNPRYFTISTPLGFSILLENVPSAFLRHSTFTSPCGVGYTIFA